MPVKYTEQLLREAVESSESFSEVLRYLNSGLSGSVHGHIKRRIQEYGIDYSHFTHRNTKTASNKKRTTGEILVLLPDNSRRTARPILLRALMEEKVPYKCYFCPVGLEWEGKNLNLEIDHENGNKLDNRKENLRFLCPNCHSQTTSNYRSLAYNPYILENTFLQSKANEKALLTKKKNSSKCPSCGGIKHITSANCRKCANGKGFPERSKIVWPLIGELIAQVRETSYTATSKTLGVSDVAIRKHISLQGYNPKTLEKFTS